MGVVNTSSSCVVMMWDILFCFEYLRAINHGDEIKSLIELLSLFLCFDNSSQ